MQVLTIDLWNTLVDSSNGDERRCIRFEALRNAVRKLGATRTEEELRDAYIAGQEAFLDVWRNEHRTLTTSEIIANIWKRLNIEAPEEIHNEVVRAFAESILHAPPRLLDGVAEVLPLLAEVNRLALISDTAFSPGIVLRQVLDRLDIAGFFTAMIFSDEAGVSKPRPEIFQKALQAVDGDAEDCIHIGDIERTDIIGAKKLGFKAILYTGDPATQLIEPRQEQTAADAVLHSWYEAPAVIRRLRGDGRA